MDDHSLLFVHKDGVIKITVEHMDGPLPPPPTSASLNGDGPSKEGKEDDGDDDDADSPIATWTYCKVCSKVITPLVYISENTWKFSFGKFLEVFFYNRDAIMNSSEYNCSVSTSFCEYFVEHGDSFVGLFCTNALFFSKKVQHANSYTALFWVWEAGGSVLL